MQSYWMSPSLCVNELVARLIQIIYRPWPATPSCLNQKCRSYYACCTDWTSHMVIFVSSTQFNEEALRVFWWSSHPSCFFLSLSPSLFSISLSLSLFSISSLWQENQAINCICNDDSQMLDSIRTQQAKSLSHIALSHANILSFVLSRMGDAQRSCMCRPNWSLCWLAGNISLTRSSIKSFCVISGWHLCVCQVDLPTYFKAGAIMPVHFVENKVNGPMSLADNLTWPRERQPEHCYALDRDHECWL